MIVNDLTSVSRNNFKHLYSHDKKGPHKRQIYAVPYRTIPERITNGGLTIVGGSLSPF